MSRVVKTAQPAPSMKRAPLLHPLVDPSELAPPVPTRVKAERSEPSFRREPSQVSGSSVMILDPYSEQVLAYSQADAAMMPDRATAAGAPAPRAPVALRVLQLALLSSLALLIWLLINLL